MGGNNLSEPPFMLRYSWARPNACQLVVFAIWAFAKAGAVSHSLLLVTPTYRDSGYAELNEFARSNKRNDRNRNSTPLEPTL